jgi:hypothetical protein
MRWTLRRAGNAPPPPLPDTSIPFVAYAADSVVMGRLALETDRLTDLLAAHETFEVRDVTLESLADDTTFELTTTMVRRADLYVVAGTGPRGNASRRVRMRRHAVHARVGPYELWGYVHALPTTEAVAFARRRSIIPLTGGFIRYDRGGQIVERGHDTILVNREQLDSLVAGDAEELEAYESALDEVRAAVAGRPT